MHRTTIAKYTKFSGEELKKSAKDTLSCVAEFQSNEILSLRPRDCDHIVKGVRRCVMDKIGRYHPKVNGIVLGYEKIRIENPLSAFRLDSPYLHVRATIDYYVFHPRLGSTLRGVVNYVSKEFVSAMIYQVFNVTVKLNGNVKTHETVKKGCEISFVVKSCDMKSDIPIIDGELVLNDIVQVGVKTEPTENEDAIGHVEPQATIEDLEVDKLKAKEHTKSKISKKKKQKLIVSEESQPVTNGEVSQNGTTKSPNAEKQELIDSLLTDLFAEMNEEPPASKKRKKTSASIRSDSKRQNGETSASRKAGSKMAGFEEKGQMFHQNSTSTPLATGEVCLGKKRKIRFDLNDTIGFIKSEPTGGKKKGEK